MYTQKFQPGEIDIWPGLAARLVAEQFPQWAGLPIRPVTVQGTWCVNYRLGDDMVVRLRGCRAKEPSDQSLSRECCPGSPSACRSVSLS
jgi:hypothetical protein